MEPGKQLLYNLNAFRQKDKFSASAWNSRGLNPSAIEMCNQLETLFNNCTDNLIEGATQNATHKQFKQTLKTGLSTFNSSEYDTEEREFICDYFSELSKILQVDIKNDLNSWLYGKVLNTLLKIVSLFKQPDKVIETVSQDCTGCEAKLETFITRKEEGILASGWIIIQCNNCNEYNLLESQPNIKQAKFGNYKWVEALSKDEYTEEGAKSRLEQIKFFRKE